MTDPQTMTIDTATEITTAARRIQRDIRTVPSALRAWYDADGRMVALHEAHLWSPDRSIYDGAVVSLAGGCYTRREVQDRIDAAATDDPQLYLYMLADAREASAN